MLRLPSLYCCMLCEGSEVQRQKARPGGADADADEMKCRFCRWPFHECQSSCGKIEHLLYWARSILEGLHICLCQGHCLSCFRSSLPVLVPITFKHSALPVKSGSVDESRRGQMNIDRTAMFAACVARGQTEGQGPARPGRKARGLICMGRVQGSCDSRIPSRCASIVGVGGVEVACGLEQ